MQLLVSWLVSYENVSCVISLQPGVCRWIVSLESFFCSNLCHVWCALRSVDECFL